MSFSYFRTIRRAGHRMRRQPLAVAGVLLLAVFVLGGALRDRLDPRTRLEIGL
jgi:ABC-type dipeptide/oligopeptide/nickel transport system permease subunit